MNSFDPQRLFSSIDEQGRYAYGNQANIILWNLSVFASTLSDFIEEDTINKVLWTMWEHMHSKWLMMMRNKLGIHNALSSDEALIRELLSWMQDTSADYSNTFLYIGWHTDVEKSEIYEDMRFQDWLCIWKQRVSAQDLGLTQKTMKKYNPVYIPRNHLVEEVLEKAAAWDYTEYNAFLEILKSPYEYRDNTQKYMKSLEGFDEMYKTYCGT